METDLDQLREALAYYDSHDGAFVMSHVGIYITAARELLALKEAAAPTHSDYDVALPEIEEWVNRSGQW